MRIPGPDIQHALKLAGHLAKTIKEVGREQALSTAIPFNEAEIIENNLSYIFGDLIDTSKILV